MPARGHDDLTSSEVLRGDAAGQHVEADVEDLGRLGQPALAGVGAGQPALGGLEDQGAALAQRRDVGPGRGVLPHLGVHRRDEDDRAPGGEQGVGQQVVGHAVRGLGHQVGRRRRDHDQVGGLPDPDVRHLVHVVPHLGGDGLAGQRGPRGGADEPQRRGGRDDGHVVTGLGEPPQQLAGLVRRDASGDPEDDGSQGSTPWDRSRSRRQRRRRPPWQRPPRRRARPGRRPHRSAGRR